MINEYCLAMVTFPCRRSKKKKDQFSHQSPAGYFNSLSHAMVTTVFPAPSSSTDCKSPTTLNSVAVPEKIRSLGKDAALMVLPPYRRSPGAARYRMCLTSQDRRQLLFDKSGRSCNVSDPGSFRAFASTHCCFRRLETVLLR